MDEPIVFIPIKTMRKWIKFIKQDKYWDVDVAKEELVNEMESYIKDKEGI